jgi:hypothetical protein
MKTAINSLSELIIKYQGNGDYEGVKIFLEAKTLIDKDLQADLDKIAKAGIPRDIIFEQGKDVLGLK